jgi:hypothetical protein
MDQIRADLVVNWLWRLDPPVHCYQQARGVDGSRRWIIPAEGGREFTDAGVIEVAERLGWGREDPPNPFYETKPDTPADRIRRRNLGVISFLRAKGLKVTINDDARTWTVAASDVFNDKHDRDSLYRLARDKGFTG